MASPTHRYVRLIALLAVAVSVSILAPDRLWSALSAYQWSTGTTTFTSITSTGTKVLSSGDDVYASNYSIGFTFNLDGSNYTAFGVNSNGLLGLTSGTMTYYYTNSFTTSFGYPILSPMWDDLYLSATNHGVWYQVTGSSPRRVLTVEWNTRHISSTAASYVMQAKLYEGTNTIEFIYDNGTAYTSGSATIGVAATTSNFASITPGSPATVSFTTSNNSINTYPSAGTYYRLSPCQGNIAIAGSVANGGTAAMNNGDTLLATKSITMGGSATYQPFSISMSALPCASTTYSFSISGPAAADYSISPTSGSLPASSTVTPTITFVPRGGGARYAYLTVADNQGLSRTYTLAAIGLPRISWNGNTAQGGTVAMADKDTLMANVGVNRGSVGFFTPFTLTNFSTNNTLPLAQITYQLIDPSGQYTISPTSAALNAGQSSTPSIRFAPTGLGPQAATLVITADNEVRRYVLYAISKAPQLRFIAGEEITPDMMVMYRSTSCAGDQVVSFPIEINNFGMGDAVITGAAILKMDTNNTLPISQKPLLYDENGYLVRDPSFQLSWGTGVAPLDHSQDVTFPFSIPAGQTRTVYLNFVGEVAGRPITKLFLWSDAQNITNTDTNDVPVTGLMSFLIGPRVVGGHLSSNVDGAPLKPLVFPAVKLGNTMTLPLVVVNSGECELTIDKSEFGMHSGDIREFSIVSAFRNSPVVNDQYVIPPFGRDTVYIAFNPDSRGGRRVTLRFKTNDSSIYLPGLTERGSRYLDVFGEGTTDLVGPTIYLGQVLVGDTITGVATIENPNLVPISIASISFAGTDAAEFSENPASPWPGLTYQMRANEKLTIGFRWISAGMAGTRTAELQLRNATGIVGSIRLVGEAGTRELTVLPLSLFDGVSLNVGQVARRQVMITNTGTFDVRLQAPVLSGNDPGNYRLGKLPRPIIAPGTTEYLEVTFSPTTSGPSSAQIDIISDATNSPAVVTLGGESMEIRPDDQQDDRSRDGGTPQDGVAGIEAELSANGMSVRVAPNPASDRLEARVVLASGTTLRGVLIDARGEVVRDLGAVSAQSGSNIVTISVADLPTGTYALRLDGGTASRTVRFVVAR